MGADLYRDGYDAIVAAARPAFDEAVIARDRHARAAHGGMPRLGTDPLTGRARPDGCATCDRLQAVIHDAYDQMHPESHYFRDSYNDSSLFWKLGLSWWEDLDAYATETGDWYGLEPDGARRLLAEVNRRAKALEYNIRDLDPESRAYFRGKYERFRAFLAAAADAGDRILCSV